VKFITEQRRSEIIHILRNPYGHSQEEIRQVQLDAADEIENLLDAYVNMRDWARENGVDTTARHP
jgi:ribosome recycling factor